MDGCLRSLEWWKRERSKWKKISVGCFQNMEELTQDLLGGFLLRNLRGNGRRRQGFMTRACGQLRALLRSLRRRFGPGCWLLLLATRFFHVLGFDRMPATILRPLAAAARRVFGSRAAAGFRGRSLGTTASEVRKVTQGRGQPRQPHQKEPAGCA